MSGVSHSTSTSSSSSTASQNKDQLKILLARIPPIIVQTSVMFPWRTLAIELFKLPGLECISAKTISKIPKSNTSKLPRQSVFPCYPSLPNRK